MCSVCLLAIAPKQRTVTRPRVYGGEVVGRQRSARLSRSNLMGLADLLLNAVKISLPTCGVFEILEVRAPMKSATVAGYMDLFGKVSP